MVHRAVTLGAGLDRLLLPPSSGALGHSAFLADLKTGSLSAGFLLSVVVASGFWTLA